jgi:hypothetical protein
VGPDLAGSYGIGRARDWSPVAVERQLAERLVFMANGVLRKHAPVIKANVQRDRMSAPHNRIGRGKYLQKNPKSAGCREIKGNLKGSVRMTVTSPGTNARAFRGVIALSAKCGGARAPYAGIHEASGRLQFQDYVTNQFVPVVAEIRSGAAQIAAEFGGRVR